MADTGVLLAFINALKGGGGTGDITDVQINGTSIVSGGVANVPVAGSDVFGVVKINASAGITLNNANVLRIEPATSNEIKLGSAYYKPIQVRDQHEAVFFGLSKAAGADLASVTGITVGTYPAAQKSAISTMLHAPETVSGTTPAITALPGVRYICGEVATLDITTPASGIVDIVFESGSTPTVLTVTPPTGVTVSWANGFDPTSLASNTTYELSFETVGTKCLAVAGEW